MPSRTLLFVIPSLQYSGAARQLLLLATGLPQQSFRVRVAVLGVETPWLTSLRRQGVEIEVLGWRRWIDARPFLQLRRLLHSMRPDVVHVWGASALRAVVLSGGRRANRLLVSAALSPPRKPAPADRWLLRQVEGIIALGAADAERYRRIGVADARITTAAPAMPIAASNVEAAELPGVSARDRVVLGLGPIEPHKGFREAVWAFDILRHLYDDVHLVLAGDGSDRPRVEQFARLIHVTDHVHFVGACLDPAPLLHRAEIVWAPSFRGGGAGAVLEAMAAGRVVIASRCPDLAEIIIDGETGCLVEPNNKADLARQTRFLLDDEGRRRCMGEAGRRRVAECFSPTRLVETCGRRYAENKN